MKRQVELKLSSLKTLAVGAFDPAKPPTKLKVFNWGKNESTNKGTFTVGDKTLATLSVNQKKYGFDTVALDFEHNTYPGTTAYKESKEPRDVAGNGTLEVIAGDGVYLNLGWTPKGLEKAANFPDLSPVPATDENGEVIFIHSVALCRQGEVQDLHLVPLSVEMESADADDADMETLRAGCAKLLGLSADASIGDIKAKLTTLRVETPNSNSQISNLEALSIEIANFKSQLGTIATLSTEITNLKSQISDQKTKIDGFQSLETKLTTLSNDWKKLFDDAARSQLRDFYALQGKVSTLSMDAQDKLPLADLRDHFEKLTATVPVKRITPLHIDETGDKPKDDAARTEKIRLTALSINDKNPSFNFRQCWTEAEKQVARDEAKKTG